MLFPHLFHASGRLGGLVLHVQDSICQGQPDAAESCAFVSAEANSAFIRQRRRYDEASPSKEQELMAYDFWLSTRGDRCLTAGIWKRL